MKAVKGACQIRPACARGMACISSGGGDGALKKLIVKGRKRMLMTWRS